METQSGVIIRIVYKGRYGFIRKEDGAEVFFHELGVINPKFDELREGNNVEFLEISGHCKGPKAIGVTVT
ncbi:MAG: cold shock domain-containing protein [Desulfitobacterium sp.]